MPTPPTTPANTRPRPKKVAKRQVVIELGSSGDEKSGSDIQEDQDEEEEEEEEDGDEDGDIQMVDKEENKEDEEEVVLRSVAHSRHMLLPE